MPRHRLHRWLPMAGVLFVVAMLIELALGTSSPDSDSSDARIATYLASESRYHRNVAAVFVLWVATLLLLSFWTTLRARLRAAEGGAGSRTALVFGAGVAGTVFNFTGALFFTAPVLAAHDARHAHTALSPDIFRLAQDVGYPLWVTGSILGSLAAWATAAVVRRSGIWPQWYAWLSIVVGVVCLFSIVFFPVIVFGLWIVVTAVLMTARPGTASRT